MRTFLVNGSLLLWICVPAAPAKTLTVCPSGCGQTTIGAAIAAASSGDTIMIGAGAYFQRLTINKDLTLQGAGAGQTILDAEGLGTTVTVAAGAVVQLQGVTVEGGDSFGIANSGNLTLSDSLVYANSYGIDNLGYLTVLRCSIVGNGYATFYNPGAAFTIVGGTANVFSSSITGNAAFPGNLSGAIALLGGSLALSNSTVSSNTGGLGNAIFIQPGTGSANLFLQTSTIVNGSTQSAPTIWANDPNGLGIVAQFDNSVIVSSGIAPNCVGLTGVISAGHNLTDDNSCGLTDPTDLVNNAHINLGPLQVNAPGTTATRALLPGSAAIDRGNCSSVRGSAVVIADQRGVSRPQGPACDIGAYELRTPVANNDGYATNQGQFLLVPAPGPLTNDLSPEGLPLTVFSATSVSHGSLSITTNGTIQYTPAAGFTGQDSFTYTAYDGVHPSNPATVSINVTPVNSPPVARDDSYSVLEGQPLNVDAAHGVLANDTDPDGDPLTAALVSAPAHGALSFVPDGHFLYIATPGFSGIDSFTYQAFDGRALSNVATVTITVKPNFGTITIGLENQPASPNPVHFTSNLGAFILGGTGSSTQSFQVAGGVYTISELRPVGWLMGNIVCNPVAGVVVDLTGSGVQLTLTNGSSVTCTFINQRPGRVTARAFADLNLDHQHESREPWQEGWTIQLYTFPTVLAAAKVTDEDGQAAFTNLQPRVYTVCEVLQAGWTASIPLVPDPAYGQPCYTVTVSPGQNTPVRFGNRRLP